MSRFPIVYSFAINATSRPPCLVIISSLSASLLNFKVNLLQRNKGKPISILYSCKGNTHVSTWPMTLVILGKTWWIYLMDSTASEGGWVGECVATICTNPLIFQGLDWCTHHLAPIMKQTYHLKGSLYQLFRDTTRHCAEGLNWRNAKEPKDIIQSARVLKAFNQGHKSGISVEASSQ